MINTGVIEFFRSTYQRLGIQPPDLHVVLGSGYALALPEIRIPGDWEEKGELHFDEIPGMAVATAPDHRGTYKYFKNKKSGRALALQLGRLHGYEGLSARQVVETVLYPRLAGTGTFILTNAAGALTRDYPVGSVLILRDHVNLTGQNPLAGPNPAYPDGRPIGPRFPDLSEGYDRGLRGRLLAHFTESGITANEGVYLGLLGPSFETPAEVELFARWGLQAVGMSTVWEAIALRHAGAKVAGLSLLCNLGCGLSPEPLDHQEVLRISRQSAKGLLEALFSFAERELASHG